MIKTLIKKILKIVGLYKAMSELRFRLKYADRNDYELRYKGLAVKFSASDPYSKKWFYPRYDDGRMHEPTIVDFLLNKLKPAHTFIDVGANLGFFTCVAAKLCSNGQVHAFEMDPKCMPLIKRNVDLNEFTNVRINNAAVSDHEGHEQIPNLESPDPRLMIAQDSSGQNLITINSVSLDHYIESNNLMPDLIKIDAEGAELKVLQGMKKILASPKLDMLVEIHCEKLKAFQSNYKDVLTLLASCGFVMTEIMSHRKNDMQTRSIDVSSTLKGNVMVFASKP